MYAILPTYVIGHWIYHGDDDHNDPVLTATPRLLKYVFVMTVVRFSLVYRSKSKCDFSIQNTVFIKFLGDTFRKKNCNVTSCRSRTILNKTLTLYSDILSNLKIR